MILNIDVSEEDNPELERLLSDRLYEFNVAATGFTDGRYLNAAILDDSGHTIAGLSGHTWGGCCEITRLWVQDSARDSGVGKALMAAAEKEARQRGCEQIVLSTHSFQAPGFYEKIGFEKLCAIPAYPKGYANVIYLKHLDQSVRD